jgi:two-component system, cell cycle sensor histidine kinase and response regulator CckA
MRAMQGRRGRIECDLGHGMLDEDLAVARPMLRALRAWQPGCTVRLAVSDDRPDIDAPMVGKNFQPILTTEEASEDPVPGPPMVHAIVQRHEGAIVVANPSGNGVSVTRYLPGELGSELGACESETGAMGAAATLDICGGRQIFFLNDDPSLVSLAERQLEPRGYRISGYVDPQEVLEVLRADPAGFDLVVFDYNMPDLSGLELARKVYSMRANLPVVLVSGYIDEEFRAEADGAGCRKWSSKTTRWKISVRG